MPTIHTTAIISEQAQLADDVEIGPYAVLEGAITLGPGCVVGPHVVLTGDLVAGANNRFHAGCRIGDAPQHTGYDPRITTRTVIGNDNTFREGVTIHRGMPNTAHPTTIGDRNLLMVNAHIAHDCIVGNDCILANGALVGGHAILQDRVFLSGNTAVHQFCRVGTMAMLGGTSCISMDLPPFWTVQGRINELHGVNIVGMRRGGHSREDITAIRFAYRLLTRLRWPIPEAIARLESDYPDSPAVRTFVNFVRTSRRGICCRHQGRRTVDEPESDSTAPG